MVTGDLHALQAGLLLPLERLSEVRCRAISGTPISALPGGLLSENEAGQLALHPRPPLKEWECCLKLSKNHSCHRFGRLAHPELLLLRLKGKLFGCPPWMTSLRGSGYPESDMNRSGRHVIGLSEFPDTLLPVILHFGSHIGDRSICGKISLIRCRCFSYFAFWWTIISSFSSRRGHGRPSGKFPESF
jgi:hypothetical protein